MKTEVLKITRNVGLLDIFKEKGFKVGVEVGTDHGEYAKKILDKLPGVKLYCVDPWKAYTEGDEVKTQAEVDEIYEYAKNLLSPYPNCWIFRQSSIEALQHFDDNSLDFVFIDGNHTYEHVFTDIVGWIKKVKPGGIIYGHDYIENKERNYGVIEAVNDYAQRHEVDTLYILRKGTYNDCWMIKV